MSSDDESSSDEDSYTGPRRVSLLIEKFEKLPMRTGSDKSSKHLKRNNNGIVSRIVKDIESGNLKAVEDEAGIY